MKIAERVSLSSNSDHDNLPVHVFMLMMGVMPTAQLLCARLHSGESLSAEEEDVDVARERQRVYEGKAQSDLLRILDLTKVSFVSLLLKNSFVQFLPSGQQDGNSII